MNSIFLFSGQGAQFKGMAQDILDEYGAANDLIKKIGDITGEDIDALYGTPKTKIFQGAIRASWL